jgi:hypothetical protein
MSTAKTAQKPMKSLNPKGADTKYTGNEPEWRLQPTEDRTSAITRALYWYHYHYTKKEAKDMIIDWLARNDRQTEAKLFHKVADGDVTPTYGWLCRLNLRGLELTETERAKLDLHLQEKITKVKNTKTVIKEEEPAEAKPNIQDRLREKMIEAASDIDGMFDDMIAAGGKMSADFKPIAVLRGKNVAPQFTPEIKRQWQIRLDELETAIAGKDPQLVEGYSNFGKMQLKNMVKFCEQVIADCGSYVQIKKVERKPRKVKPVSPEKRAAKFKLLAEFAELKLKSLPASQLIDKSEAWLYDTKKRKLLHLVADTHVGAFTIKNNSIIGFSTSDSVMKTLRKPAEQLKELAAASVPQARKFFKDIKATEIKFNGRGNENLILLRSK